jgi:hypothetical protein
MWPVRFGSQEVQFVSGPCLAVQEFFDPPTFDICQVEQNRPDAVRLIEGLPTNSFITGRSQLLSP